MYLPESLQEQSFVTWNHIVKGLVQVWEMARLMGLEARLEARLLCDRDAALARRLGELGNDPVRMANVLRHCLEMLSVEETTHMLCVAASRPIEGPVASEDRREADEETPMEQERDKVAHAA
ncbi:MAG TPA: hypothetical protein VKU00_26960 [Chthonomonadaceae bacterium]|nr:hypothetical protein [Chthonomonadaceae bacterium]